MGRPKKEETVQKISMGAAFAASIADKVKDFKGQNSDADSQRMLALKAEGFVFDGYVTSELREAEDGFVPLLTLHKGYCNWAVKHISQDDFLALVAGSKLKLIVIQQKDLFCESAILAIAGHAMNYDKGDVVEVNINRIPDSIDNGGKTK